MRLLLSICIGMQAKNHHRPNGNKQMELYKEGWKRSSRRLAFFALNLHWHTGEASYVSDCPFPRTYAGMLWRCTVMQRHTQGHTLNSYDLMANPR